MERDKNGFLNCKKCSRRFVTEVGIQNHINIQHGSIVLESQKTVHKNASNLPEETVDDGHYQPKEIKIIILNKAHQLIQNCLLLTRS